MYSRAVLDSPTVGVDGGLPCDKTKAINAFGRNSVAHLQNIVNGSLSLVFFRRLE